MSGITKDLKKCWMDTKQSNMTSWKNKKRREPSEKYKIIMDGLNITQNAVMSRNLLKSYTGMQ